MAATTGAPPTRRPRILIAGAGFAGFECAKRLTRMAPGAFDVTIVNPEDYSLYTPLLPDVAGGLLDPRHIAIPIVQALPGVRLLRGEVVSADLVGHTALVNVAGRPDEPDEAAWDRLVVTCGSVTKLFDVPGLAEHALGLKTLGQALYLRDHLIGELQLSVNQADDRLCEACRTVVVVGSSYAGTELIAQLRGLADSAARNHGFPRESVRFLLLDIAEHVMPEVGRKLGDRALDVLRQRDIEVRLKTTLNEVTADSVTLSDGTVVPTHTVAWVTGVTPSPLVKDLGLAVDGGRLTVTDHLAVPNHPDVFAGGDAAGVPDVTRPGKITPPTAQHAIRQGHALARNVAASLGHGRARPYRHRDMGLVVDLGPGFAVANPLGFQLSGRTAKAVARAYHLFALPRNANRAYVLADYLSTSKSRPVVSLGLIAPGRARFAVSERRMVGAGGRSDDSG